MTVSKLSAMMNTLSKLSVESNVLQYLKDKVSVATTKSIGTVKPDNATTILAPKFTTSLQHYTLPVTADKLALFEDVPASDKMLSVNKTVTMNTVVISRPSVSLLKINDVQYLKFMATSWLNPPQAITDFLIVVPELGITHTTKATLVNGLMDLSIYAKLPDVLTITTIAMDVLGNKSDSSITILYLSKAE